MIQVRHKKKSIQYLKSLWLFQNSVLPYFGIKNLIHLCLLKCLLGLLNSEATQFHKDVMGGGKDGQHWVQCEYSHRNSASCNCQPFRHKAHRNFLNTMVFILQNVNLHILVEHHFQCVRNVFQATVWQWTIMWLLVHSSAMALTGATNPRVLPAPSVQISTHYFQHIPASYRSVRLTVSSPVVGIGKGFLYQRLLFNLILIHCNMTSESRNSEVRIDVHC
jgi:hypothetical protein